MHTARFPNRPAAVKLIAVLCALSVGGCAMNPIVAIPLPQVSARVETLGYARAYAEGARQAYLTAIRDQIGNTTALTSGLIGLGAVITGLASGQAHRDAILGASLLGGTAYAIGNISLDKRRPLIYLAGVEGINCALVAVTPLSMSDDQLAALRSDILAAAGKVADVRNAAAVVAGNQVGLGKAPPALSDAIKASLVAAETAAVESDKVLSTARQLANNVQQAGGELMGAVRRISAAVDRAMLDTVPDLTAVPKIVGGLAGFASSLAPGAGIDKALGDALKKYDTTSVAKSGELQIEKSKPKAAPDPDLVALEAQGRALDSAVLNMRGAIANIQAELLGFDSSALPTEALKACGVADVASALTVSTDKVAFPGKADATRSFFISGGTKPYVVELDDAPVNGVAVKGPAPFESRAQVTVTAAAANGDYTITVLDSSSPSKPRQVKLHIGPEAAAAAAAGPDTVSSTASKPADLTDIAKQINTLPAVAITPEGGKAVTLKIDDQAKARVSADGSSISVGVTCTPKPSAPLPESQVRQWLLGPGGVGLKEEAASLGKGFQRLLVTAKATCVKAGA